VWYTFWASSSATQKEDELFEVCGEETVSYAAITLGIEEVLDGIMVKATENWEVAPSIEEREELKGYMKQFLIDVDKHYT
jgi:hypothetical protein